MKPMTGEESSIRDGKRCVACREIMLPDATKCSHCGSFQNWRRYLSLTTVFLSLLVALFSVLTVGVSVFNDAIIPKRAKLNVVILNQSSDLLFQLVISNKGNAPGLIGTMFRPIVSNEGDRDITLYPYDQVNHKDTDWPMEVPANSFRLIKVEGHLRSPPNMAVTKKKFGCKIEFTVIQTTGVKTFHEIYCTENY